MRDNASVRELTSCRIRRYRKKIEDDGQCQFRFSEAKDEAHGRPPVTVAESTPFCDGKRERNRISKNENKGGGSRSRWPRSENGEENEDQVSVRLVEERIFSLTHVESLEEGELGSIGGSRRVEGGNGFNHDVRVANEDPVSVQLSWSSEVGFLSL